MIVLDTHVWVWWVSGFKRLSRKGERTLEKAAENKAMYISSISAWEVAQLAARGRLQLTTDPSDWIAQSEALPFLTFIPVDNRIAVKSVSLPGPLHQDPVDRIIIATAMILGAVLMTKDDKMLRYPHVKTLW